MLGYLVTSQTRRSLLELMWAQGRSGSMRELAMLGGLTYSAVQREVEGMMAAGLAKREVVGGAHRFCANRASPHARLLTQLLRSSKPTHETPPTEDRAVYTTLVRYGAPLASARLPEGTGLPLEEALTHALRLAHRDPTLTRVLPVVIWRQRHTLSIPVLEHLAKRLDERQTLGFFLELTGQLAKDDLLQSQAAELRDKRRRRMRYFFGEPRGTAQRRLVELNTPPVARSWHFLMNMPMETFVSHFEKFANASISS